MTDLEVMRSVRDHFKKNYNHAEEWAYDAKDCLVIHAIKVTCGPTMLDLSTDNRLFDQAHRCTTDILGPRFWNRIKYQKVEFLQKIERKIAQLEEMEISNETSILPVVRYAENMGESNLKGECVSVC